MRQPRAPLLLVVLSAAALALPGAASASPSKFEVVAAENFWGSIASQLGGDRVDVQSIIVNPDTDPHDYQPTASDARTMAVAQVAIVNGIGYDTWASQLLAANASGGRVVVDAGDVLGLKEGDNPHQWYSPSSVSRMVDAIAAAFAKSDPRHAAYFAARKASFERRALAPYNALRSRIRQRYAGVPVGYSESIFQPLGASLGLDLATPASFAKAIAEGTEVSAADKQTVQNQLRRHLVKVWIFNSQNVTPEIEQLNKLAAASHIPVVTITETLSPATSSFHAWQTAQLSRLRRALHAATGR
jgi:zinc/manganese transport system substrate-binding protein